MARIKDITFESGSLTGTNGADSTTGASIAIDGTSAIKGTYTGKIAASAGTGYVQEQWTAADSVWFYFYIKVSSGPTAAAVICDLRDASGGIYRIRADSDEFWLADAANTQIGSRFTYTTDTIYRLGLRYTKGTGSDAIVEFFAVAGDDPFGAAIASTSAGTGTVQADRVRIGATNSQTSTFFIDNIRIDDASMPTDDVVGGTTYNQSVNVTVGSSLAVIKQINKPLYFTGVSVFGITKQTTHTINVTVAVSASVFKQITKTISTTVGNVVPDIVKQVNKNVNAVVNSVVSIGKAISKTINITSAANVVISYGLQFYQTINVTVGNAVTMSKTVNKIIRVPVTVAMNMHRVVTNLTQAVIGFGRNIGLLSMRTRDENTQSLTGTDSKTISIDPDDKTTI